MFMPAFPLFLHIAEIVGMQIPVRHDIVRSGAPAFGMSGIKQFHNGSPKRAGMLLFAPFPVANGGFGCRECNYGVWIRTPSMYERKAACTFIFSGKSNKTGSYEIRKIAGPKYRTVSVPASSLENGYLMRRGKVLPWRLSMRVFNILPQLPEKRPLTPFEELDIGKGFSGGYNRQREPFRGEEFPDCRTALRL